jgi:apolipoprotein N-acyltransferase
MTLKHDAASRLLAAFAFASASLANLAEAQPYGPSQGGPGEMMGRGWGWGMGFGMGGMGLVWIAVLALVVLVIALLVFRRRSS